MAIATPVPFVATAAVTALAMAGFAVAILRRGVPDQGHDDPEPPGETIRALRHAVADEPALKAVAVLAGIPLIRVLRDEVD
jgi:hypothetical protein